MYASKYTTSTSTKYNNQRKLILQHKVYLIDNTLKDINTS